MQSLINASTELETIYADHIRANAAQPVRYLVYRVKSHIDRELAQVLRGEVR